jgi:hypothetical protein
MVADIALIPDIIIADSPMSGDAAGTDNINTFALERKKKEPLVVAVDQDSKETYISELRDCQR